MGMSIKISSHFIFSLVQLNIAYFLFIFENFHLYALNIHTYIYREVCKCMFLNLFEHLAF